MKENKWVRLLAYRPMQSRQAEAMQLTFSLDLLLFRATSLR
jgi:hypothetical protein